MQTRQDSRKALVHVIVAVHYTAAVGYWAFANVPAWNVENIICLVGFGVAGAYCWQQAFRAYRERGVKPPDQKPDATSEP